MAARWAVSRAVQLVDPMAVLMVGLTAAWRGFLKAGPWELATAGTWVGPMAVSRAVRLAVSMAVRLESQSALLMVGLWAG